MSDRLSDLGQESVNAVLAELGLRARVTEAWDQATNQRRAAEIKEILRKVPHLKLLEVSDNLDERKLLTPPTASALPVRATDRTASSQDPSPHGPIFVVHGHDHQALHYVVRVLHSLTGREVIVLHEQANSGRTIIEKFEHHAASAAYAVVLLTADDHGGVAGKATRPRARQNVIFELGFFYAKLGRDRVAVLLGDGVEEPSDINGILYISLDPGGAWKQLLARELSAARIRVDFQKMP